MTVAIRHFITHLGWVPRDRSGGKQDGAKDVKVTVSYSPLREALEHRWSGVPRRQTKSLNPAVVFIILGKDTECLVPWRGLADMQTQQLCGNSKVFTRVISQTTLNTRTNLNP